LRALHATGTNPLCFGIPTDEEFPFVIDCATSINQRGECITPLLSAPVLLLCSCLCLRGLSSMLGAPEALATKQGPLASPRIPCSPSHSPHHCTLPTPLHAGKIEKYERLGMDTPKGMVIDTEGKERTDTVQVRA
jgi:hypothetical protein